MSTPNKTRLGNLGKDYGAVAKSIEWGTPQYLYDALDHEFNFTLDVAASDKLHVCERYFTKEIDGLKQSWANERAFMNPPYGRDIADWVEKANKETFKECILVVGLLPVRADTRWFHNHILPNAEIRFIKGRLKFGGFKQGAAFASMIVIWRNEGNGNQEHSSIDNKSMLAESIRKQKRDLTDYHEDIIAESKGSKQKGILDYYDDALEY